MYLTEIIIQTALYVLFASEAFTMASKENRRSSSPSDDHYQSSSTGVPARYVIMHPGIRPMGVKEKEPATQVPGCPYAFAEIQKSTKKASRNKARIKTTQSSFAEENAKKPARPNASFGHPIQFDLKDVPMELIDKVDPNLLMGLFPPEIANMLDKNHIEPKELFSPGKSYCDSLWNAFLAYYCLLTEAAMFEESENAEERNYLAKNPHYKACFFQVERLLAHFIPLFGDHTTFNDNSYQVAAMKMSRFNSSPGSKDILVKAGLIPDVLLSPIGQGGGVSLASALDSKFNRSGTGTQTYPLDIKPTSYPLPSCPPLEVGKRSVATQVPPPRPPVSDSLKAKLQEETPKNAKPGFESQSQQETQTVPQVSSNHHLTASPRKPIEMNLALSLSIYNSLFSIAISKVTKEEFESLPENFKDYFVRLCAYATVVSDPTDIANDLLQSKDQVFDIDRALSSPKTPAEATFYFLRARGAQFPKVIRDEVDHKAVLISHGFPFELGAPTEDGLGKDGDDSGKTTSPDDIVAQQSPSQETDSKAKEDESSEESGLSALEILFISIAVIAVVGLAGGGIYWYYTKKN